MNRVLAILLAGGAGERLFPLTRDLAKPAVPFGGSYRIIDFTLSNCLNSGVRRIFILTQYKPLALSRHIRDGWNIVSPELGEFIEVLPPMKRLRDDWYLGTADAVFQNSESLEEDPAPDILILSGDHIYKMDYGKMLRWHEEKQADVTLATILIAPEEAYRFGICELDENYRILGFEEKPQHGNPRRSVFDPARVSASMGVYVFRKDILLQALAEDSQNVQSSHDFGKDILPAMLGKARVIAYNFIDINAKDALYWRDVGTVEAFYEANMDLVAVTPEFNLYDERWPIRTVPTQKPPAKFVFAQEGRRMGIALDSIVCHGCIISGGRVIKSVLSPGVKIHSYCEVEYSILMPDVEVGRYSRVRRAIIDSGVRIPESQMIGFDAAADRAAGFLVTDSGITVVSAPNGPRSIAARVSS